MKIIGIIPARYSSTRLPGKPLAIIAEKPMIQHVYERALQAFDHVLVATDDERIVDAVHAFGGKAVFTSRDHNTGTNRCLEAYSTYTAETNLKFDVVVNIQGDEPLLDPQLLKLLADSFEDSSVSIATLATGISDADELFDDNRVFLVKNIKDDALYFSRWPIPHLQGIPKSEWLNNFSYLKHIGLYAYTPKALQTFASMPMSALEKAESLEQNRWLESAHSIRVRVCNHNGISVDTPEDLEKVRRIMASAV